LAAEEWLFVKLASLGDRRMLHITRRIFDRVAGRNHTAAQEALRRIAKRNVTVNSVTDVGASDGRWSAIAEQFWPDARYHLIEAFDHWRSELDALIARKRKYSYTLAAAGPHVGQVGFAAADDPFGGAIDLTGTVLRKVQMVTIDSEVGRLGLPPPYLIKLDTHGPEREILSGASATLRSTNLIINEFYNFQSEERRWPQMVSLIEGFGFHCVDIIDPLWRSDGVLWQMDFAFARHDRPEFSTKTFIV
jgi:FkbM family methyltransferase